MQVQVRRQMRREDFNCYGALQPGIAGQIHFAHTARAEEGLNFVRPQFCAGGQCHARIIDRTIQMPQVLFIDKFCLFLCLHELAD